MYSARPSNADEWKPVRTLCCDTTLYRLVATGAFRSETVYITAERSTVIKYAENLVTYSHNPIDNVMPPYSLELYVGANTDV